MRILVTGGQGQVGTELAGLAWPEGSVLHLPTRDELDICSAQSVADIFARHRWDAVVNSAAWTAVDAAEDNIGAAWLSNAQGPAYLAEATYKAGIPLVHISTDYVFAGDLDRPYEEGDRADPSGVYGASKLGGELAVLKGNPRNVVLRTAWVLSSHRSNFAKTMLRLAADRDTISVVADQLGCPTSAADIARAVQTIVLRMLAEQDAPTGVYHFVNSGEASWAELATEIFKCSGDLGGPTAAVMPIATADYPTRANRPPNSRLNTAKLQRDYGVAPREWRPAVAEIIGQILVAYKRDGTAQ